MEASALHHPVGLGRLSVAGPLLRLRTDEQLVALFRAGHDEAFGTIHDRYRQRLFAYARQMLGGSWSDAEDVLQDVFLRAYHALRSDDRSVNVRAWLYRVAHNRCIDQLRRPAPAAADIYDLNRGLQADLLSEAERREDLRQLVADVRRLPEQQRSALLMREMEGLSYSELAAALDVTVPAVKSLLVRARVGLVEAGEARDTACAEIRTDLASAFDRGVRASGRSRRHLRECSGCRDYRSALRTMEKQLNGLAPSSGPLAALAKILGLGGAGSGAAAGGSVAVGGGGGAAVVGSGAATVGTGAVAATAGKVAAVVAAAAVVGGGAATVQRVEQRNGPAHTAVHRVAPPSAVAPDTQLRVDRSAVVRHAAAPALVGGAMETPHSVARLDHAGAPVVSSTSAAPTYEPTTGGLQAPDEPPSTTDPATGTAGAGSTGTGIATGTAGSTTGSGATTPGSGATAATGTSAGTPTGSGTAAAGSGPASAGTTTGSGTGATAAPATSSPGTAPTSPSGQTSPTASGSPVAQGAAAPPAG